ncbi:hypothetical protein CDAR_424601 [Caerostris darwini]|uniref:Uncharacterized protein n=1 Tax=Caerostris darwini TaxID=1538125 RepID=A0AAV4VCQ2_9ARAC|nr:hypothetical protein CDAR_424601 [Caerostris darwini]
MPKTKRNKMAYVNYLTPVTRRRGSFTSSQVSQQNQQNELDKLQSTTCNPDNIQSQTRTDSDPLSLEEIPPEPFKQHPSNNVEVTAVEDEQTTAVITSRTYTKRKKQKKPSPPKTQKAPKRSRIRFRNPSASETHQHGSGEGGHVLSPSQPTVITPKEAISSSKSTPRMCKTKQSSSDITINKANQNRCAIHPFSPRPPIRTTGSRAANPHSTVNNRIRTGRFCPQRVPARQSIWRFVASRLACTIL